MTPPTISRLVAACYQQQTAKGPVSTMARVSVANGPVSFAGSIAG